MTLIDDGDGFSTSYTKEPGSDLFGEPERLTSGNVLAAAADGSVIAVRGGFFCAGETLCVVARRRPPGGPWPTGDERGGRRRRAPFSAASAVTANPDASYTAVWGESSRLGEPAPPGTVLSSDRGVGEAGAWAASTARR